MTRRCLALVLLLLALTACAPAPLQEERLGEGGGQEYAQCFTLTDLEGGGKLLRIDDGQRFLLLPPGATVPAEEEGRVLSLPLEGIYLADSSAMDLFSCIDALSAVRFSALEESGWTLPRPREAMKRGEILYAGKYSAPDYELLLEEGCTLAIENTMISHSPEIPEELEALGIPVLISRASYEPHPLGRLEWVKLYGLLTGREEQAQAFFREQARRVKSLELGQGGQRSAAIFYLSSGGAVNIRAPGDYVTRMLELAGGRSVFQDLETNQGGARANLNLQAEQFYALARDADVFFYNGSVDGGLERVDQLLEKAPCLSDCKAVREGEVWCTRRSLFQESSGIGRMIEEFYLVLSGQTEGEALEYLYRLK